MIENSQIDSAIRNVESDTKYILEIIDKTVYSYTEDLDRIMKEIDVHVISQTNPPIDVLEKYFLELSNCVYFVAERTERVGIYDGVSKAAAREVYNSAYLANQFGGQLENNKKPTVAESTAKAESASIHETMVNEVYNRAYKIIKSKVDAAQTMISTLSKVISRRMAENQFSNVNNNGRQILNEEVPTWKPF